MEAFEATTGMPAAARGVQSGFQAVTKTPTDDNGIGPGGNCLLQLQGLLGVIAIGIEDRQFHAQPLGLFLHSRNPRLVDVADVELPHNGNLEAAISNISRHRAGRVGLDCELDGFGQGRGRDEQAGCRGNNWIGHILCE